MSKHKLPRGYDNRFKKVQVNNLGIPFHNIDTALLDKIHVLVLDDWGLMKLSLAQQRDLLEVIEDRYERRSTIITSQLSVDHWHETMADPMLADAILDRLIHRAYRLKLEGESMRKHRAELHESAQLSSL